MWNLIAEIFQKRSWDFKLGVLLTFIFSVIVGFLNIGVLYLIGIPAFGLVIGLIFVWLAREKIKFKLVVTVLSISLILYSFSIFYFLFLPRAEPEIFLIPESLYGKHIAIVFERSCGQPVNYEVNSRLYNFPADGILILKDRLTTGKTRRKFYLVDKNGTRTELTEFRYDTFEEEKEIWHWRFSKTPLTKDSAGVYPEYHSPTMNMSVFNVGDFQTFEAVNKFATRSKNERLGEIENRVEKLLERCQFPYRQSLY